MDKHSTKSNLLRWLTLYMLVGLAVLLFVVDLFSPFSPQAGAGISTPTILPKYVRQTAVAQANATNTATALRTALVQAQLTAIATNPLSLSTSPVYIPLTIKDEKKLISGDQDTMKMLNDQLQSGISSQKLQGRLVALILIYVGVDSANNPLLQSDAPQVATQIESILKEMASQKDSALQKAKYQSIIFIGQVHVPDDPNQMSLQGSKNLSTADLELYLYATNQ